MGCCIGSTHLIGLGPKSKKPDRVGFLDSAGPNGVSPNFFFFLRKKNWIGTFGFLDWVDPNELTRLATRSAL
jgi:hypothetical protein